MRMTKIESDENLARVDNLINLHARLADQHIGSSAERDDILRSAVVFLHSTIEELVRNLFIERLPNQERAILDEIPFSVHASSHRAKGIMLGELAREYNGIFIENIVLDSINSYVNSMNLNDTTQLSVQLKKVGIDISKISSEFQSINGLMKRRHQIVHQMDRSNSLDPDTYPISEIHESLVVSWRNSVQRLLKSCLEQ